MTTTILLSINIVLLVILIIVLAAIFCGIDNFMMWMNGRCITPKNTDHEFVKLLRKHLQKPKNTDNKSAGSQ